MNRHQMHQHQRVAPASLSRDPYTDAVPSCGGHPRDRETGVDPERRLYGRVRALTRPLFTEADYANDFAEAA